MLHYIMFCEKYCFRY